MGVDGRSARHPPAAADIELIELLMQFGIDLRPSTPLLGRAMQLGRLLSHPVYDCVYLALGEHEDATFVTADRRLVERAAKHRLRVPLADLAAF